MKNYTDKFEESMQERNDRINAMLKCMFVEATLYAMRRNEPLPVFTQREIANFCGCSKDHIRRLQESALSTAKELLTL